MAEKMDTAITETVPDIDEKKAPEKAEKKKKPKVSNTPEGMHDLIQQTRDDIKETIADARENKSRVKLNKLRHWQFVFGQVDHFLLQRVKKTVRRTKVGNSGIILRMKDVNPKLLEFVSAHLPADKWPADVPVGTKLESISYVDANRAVHAYIEKNHLQQVTKADKRKAREVLKKADSTDKEKEDAQKVLHTNGNTLECDKGLADLFGVAVGTKIIYVPNEKKNIVGNTFISFLSKMFPKKKAEDKAKDKAEKAEKKAELKEDKAEMKEEKAEEKEKPEKKKKDKTADPEKAEKAEKAEKKEKKEKKAEKAEKAEEPKEKEKEKKKDKKEKKADKAEEPEKAEKAEKAEKKEKKKDKKKRDAESDAD